MNLNWLAYILHADVYEEFQLLGQIRQRGSSHTPAADVEPGMR